MPAQRSVDVTTTSPRQRPYGSQPRKKDKKVEAAKQTRGEVQYPAGADKKTQEAVEAPASKIDKKDAGRIVQ